MLKRKNVVLGFLLYENKVLLTKRSKGDYYPEKWAGITGFIDEGKTPYKSVINEILEETSIPEKDLNLLKEGKVVSVPDEKIRVEWIVHPYLFESRTNTVRLNRESTDYLWIDPPKIGEFDTIPMLKEIYENL
jgi:ADP-ribose pyrophosphatase YjhB (NUDIX family)